MVHLHLVDDRLGKNFNHHFSKTVPNPYLYRGHFFVAMSKVKSKQ